ncbi:MAG: DUF2167 domain-containing protein [Thermoguttaceae bacterium]
MRFFVVCQSPIRSFRRLTLFALMAMASGVGSAADSKDAAVDAKRQKAMALFQSIEWQDGPGTGQLGAIAEIKIPDGYRFTGQDGAKKWSELNHNIPSNAEMGVLMPKNYSGWFIIFTYNDSGHVADDEKGELDAAAILQTLRQGNDLANEERHQRGWAPLDLVGWQVPPAYEDATHHLVWALRVSSEGRESINYNTRILGRTGVMSANLIVAPDKFENAIAPSKQLLADYQFAAGRKYSEWRSGDRIAQYGLTGLITGGLVVAAAKTGLLAKLGVMIAKFAKPIIIGVLALGAGIAKFFRNIFGGRNRTRL